MPVQVQIKSMKSNPAMRVFSIEGAPSQLKSHFTFASVNEASSRGSFLAARLQGMKDVAQIILATHDGQDHIGVILTSPEKWERDIDERKTPVLIKGLQKPDTEKKDIRTPDLAMQELIQTQVGKGHPIIMSADKDYHGSPEFRKVMEEYLENRKPQKITDDGGKVSIAGFDIDNRTLTIAFDGTCKTGCISSVGPTQISLRILMREAFPFLQKIEFV